MATGLKMKAIHPSKPCSTQHSPPEHSLLTARPSQCYIQWQYVKCIRPNSSKTWTSHTKSTTKATAQAIGQPSVVLEHQKSHHRLCATSYRREPALPLPPVAPRQPRRLSSNPGHPQYPFIPSRKRSLKSSHAFTWPDATCFQNGKGLTPR